MARGTMRDVDFLLAAREGTAPALDRAVVYRYRSGILRPRVKAALHEMARQGDGTGLATGRLPLAIGFAESSLFPSIATKYHDWPERTSKEFDTVALERSLAYLAASLDRPSIHFVKHGSPVGRHRGWPAVLRGARVLDEPAITHESLPSVLRYLAAVTDLAPGDVLLGQPRFRASFAGLIEERAELPDILQTYEERVLLCTDPDTHRFDEARYQRDVVRRRGHRALLPHLRDLVTLRRERDLVDLLCGFDERRAECGWSAAELVVELYRATKRLLEPMSDRAGPRVDERGRVASHRVLEGAVLWAALVLAWEACWTRSLCEEADGYRRGPDLLVPALASLGRDFLAREVRAEAGDPLIGRWPAVARVLCRCGVNEPSDPGTVLAKARGDLVRALSAALLRSSFDGRSWLGSLHDQAAAACVRLDDKARRDEERAAEGPGDVPAPLIFTPPPSPLHRTFASVIDRRHAVDALRRHARERKHGVDLLLHGPDGVGKRTLAWSYARIVLCAQPVDEGPACGACDSCRAFDTGTCGCIEVDGARPDIARLTDQLVKRVQSDTDLTDRYVFVIRNADRYPPAVFDKLLKPMEDSGRASFVLLARDPRGVRLAGRSRCFDYRVRMLDRREAEDFVRAVLTARSVICDDAVIARLAEAGGGLPARLLAACEGVAGAPP